MKASKVVHLIGILIFQRLLTSVPAKVLWISDNESFIEGNSVTLACRVKGNPVPYVSWISPNGTVLQNKTNSENNTYTIQHMYGWHVGAYRCMVQNVHGGDDRITYIYLPPKINTIHPQSITVNESNTITIFCNATGLPQPSITWTKADRNEEVISSGETLTIPSIRRNQTGVYVCTASNGVLGSASGNSSINVQFSPSIIYTSPSQSITENETLTLFCNATGNPLPPIQWFKVNSTNVVFPIGSQLTIERIKADDKGIYKCVADNGIGRPVAKDIHINVLVSPTIDVIFPKTQVVTESSSATIFCNATGNPEPNITWTKDEDRSLILPKGKTLMLSKINRNCTGTYRCTAENGVIKTAQGIATINVHYSPMIVRAPKDQFLNKTNPLILFCNATGNPAPNITWEKIGGSIRVFKPSQMLYINETSKIDEGIYRCTAENGIGSAVNATAYVKINAFVAPIFNHTQTNLTVNESSSAMLHCNASGNPSPTIHWSYIKHGLTTKISNEESLFLNNIQRNETGIYSCIATNGVGDPAITDTFVDVQYGPEILNTISQLTVNERDVFTVKCNTSGNPSPDVKWKKVGLNQTYIIYHQEVLNFTMVTKRQAGTYVCEAKNILGTASASVKLTVQYKPTSTVLTSNTSNNTAEFGSTLFINCTTDAVPKAHLFKLFNNGQLLEENELGLFVLSHVNRSNEGSIQCLPYNVLGAGELAEMNLTVRFEIEPMIQNHSDNLVTNEGQHFILYCNATGFPAPSITWLFQHSDLNKTLRSNTSSLVVMNATREDNGAYICQAANGVGSAAVAIVNVSVQYKPEMLRPLKRFINSWKGRQAILTCEANGNPVPTITWSRPGLLGTIAMNERTAKSTLSVMLTSSSLFGTYVCNAQNSVGKISSEINVIELVAPGSPFIERIEPGNDTITITWNKPKSDGGTPVTSYVVEVKREGDETWASCTTQGELRCSIPGLKIATGYTVRITAQNIVSKGKTNEVQIVVTEHDIRLLDERWSGVLYSTTSTNFTRLSSRFEREVWNSYSSVDYVKGIKVINFRPGSVITKFRIARLINTTDHLKPLEIALDDGYLGQMRAEFYFEKPECEIDTFKKITHVLIFAVTLTRNKEQNDVESESNQGEADKEGSSGKNESNTNEDEGIEMDIWSVDLDGKVSRLSVNSGINSPRPPRPHTPMTKNRVHPATPEMLQDDNSRREGVYTTQPATGIPTEYAHVLERSGTRDRLYAELAWLEKKGRPKRRTRLPSISGSSAIQHRKYSILEILQKQQQEVENSKETNENEPESEMEY
ncbi:hemicentin-1-like [Actinia tenebrosa]|uniref:Hemicentin-1-like n=1 Tax=Actinia tenebrosa TaxID=6105 RepID=A0A6P8IM61_ACTTE|nr:hemicentin-1-like [Actinia tenebrosa]